MRISSGVLRAVAKMAVFTGYAAAKTSARLRSRSVSPSAGNWRNIAAEGVRLRAPETWGDLERDVLGRFVLHTRPRRFRVDGDAVWYSMAIELRILPGAPETLRNAEAMTVTYRTIETDRGPVTIELAMANGVGRRQGAIAQAVLAGAEAAQPHKSGARNKDRRRNPDVKGDSL
jgi:hypothetical protein